MASDKEGGIKGILGEELKIKQEELKQAVRDLNDLRDAYSRAKDIKDEFEKKTGRGEVVTRAEKKAYRDAKKAIDDYSDASKKAKDNVDNLEKSVEQLAETFEKQSQAVDKLGQTLKSFGDSVLNNVKDQVFKFDEASSKLKKTFGVPLGTEFTTSLNKNFQELKKYGVTAEQIGISITSLNNGIANFDRFSRQNRDEITKNTVYLEGFGMKADNLANSFESMTNVLGMSNDEALQTQRSLMDLGEAIGKTPEKIASDFDSVRKTVAKFGKDGIDTFFNMEVASRRLGVEMSTVTSIAEGFDTFEGAGKSVGQLNAVLGGPFLNAIEMIQETDPVKRLEMVRDAIAASGQSFEDMSYAQKQTFASIIPGIGGDVDALGRVMRDLDEGLLETSGDIKASIEGSKTSMGDLEDQFDKSRTLREKMEGVKAAAVPDVNSLGAAARAAADSLRGLAAAAAPFITFVGLVTSAIGSMIGIMGTLKGFQGLPGALRRITGGGGAAAAARSGAAALGKTALKASIPAALLGGIIDYYMFGESLGASAAGAGGSAAGAAALATIGSFVFPGAGTVVGGLIGGAVGNLLAKEVYKAEMEPEVPAMAEGGIVTKPTLAVVGEGGQPEVVTPLDQLGNVLSTFAKVVPSGLLPAGMNQPPIHIKIELDGRELKSFVKNVTAEQFNPLV